MQVELRATRMDDGSIVWCNPSEADHFSVYIGEAGAFTWLADFANESDAVAWASFIANLKKYEFVDRRNQWN
jgi:ApbE superfamily uncharacterized protein (UPF0280 family)